MDHSNALIESDGSDSELPEVQLSPSSKMDKVFFVDTIVWAMWKKKFWPALVRNCNLKQKKLSLVYVDAPVLENGRERRFTVPFNKVIKFDGSERSKELMNSGLHGDDIILKKSIETARSYILKKGTGDFTGSPVQYLHDPLSYLIASRKAVSCDTTPEKCQADKKIVEDGGKHTLSDECSEKCSDTESCDANELAEEPQKFTKLQENLSEEIMIVIKSDACKDYLLKVLKGEVESSRYKNFSVPKKSKRRKLEILCYDEVLKHSQINEIVDYVKPLTEDASTDVFYPVRCAMDVLVPEAVVFALQSVLKISKSEAEDFLDGGSRPEALNKKITECNPTPESS